MLPFLFSFTARRAAEKRLLLNNSSNNVPPPYCDYLSLCLSFFASSAEKVKKHSGLYTPVPASVTDHFLSLIT
jgi:hypothetical protein